MSYHLMYTESYISYPPQVTYADFAVYVLLECLVPEMPPLTDNFPNIAKLMEAVAGLERSSCIATLIVTIYSYIDSSYI